MRHISLSILKYCCLGQDQIEEDSERLSLLTQKFRIPNQQHRERSTEGEAAEIHCFPPLANRGEGRQDCESAPRDLWKKEKNKPNFGAGPSAESCTSLSDVILRSLSVVLEGNLN